MHYCIIEFTFIFTAKIDLIVKFIAIICYNLSRICFIKYEFRYIKKSYLIKIQISNDLETFCT